MLVALAYGCLTHAFITHDFSLKLAANHSHTALPLVYRITAVWGNHEGSILLWSLILSGWTLAVSLFSNQLDAPRVARVLGVMGLVSTGFLLFTLFTSNPFTRLLPAAPLLVELRHLLLQLVQPGLGNLRRVLRHGELRAAAAEGDEGEIFARGPQMLVGYLHPEDEADVFDAESAPVFIDYNHVCDLGNLLVARALAKAIPELRMV